MTLTSRHATGPRVATLAAACLLLVSRPSTGDEVLIPGVAGRVPGASGALWSSELRVTNTTREAKTFSTTDWIGTPGWTSKHWSIPAGQTVSISGIELFGDPRSLADHASLFGAVIASVDSGLLLQTAILAGVYRRGGDAIVFCPSWAGGYLAPENTCNFGSGPIIDATRFFPVGTDILLPWLSTDLDRRTNLSLINPDPTMATVTVQVTTADGTRVITDTLTVDPHSVIQLNDVFGTCWASAREHNANQATAARLLIQSSTRLYALAWVISEDNNTVGVSTPSP